MNNNQETMGNDIRFFGHPEDCSGWRQFLVLRPCPELAAIKPPIRNLDQLLPFVIWIAIQPDPKVHLVCSSPAYRVHPDSERALKMHLGLTPYEYPVACEHQGRFIE